MGGFFRFMKGFLIGAAVGGGATLLLAPWGGNELRELVKDRLAYIIAEGRLAAEAKRLEMEEEFERLRRVELK
jgi:gas vesicle protein